MKKDGGGFRPFGRRVISIALTQHALMGVGIKLSDRTVVELPHYLGIESFNPSHAHVIGVLRDDYEYRISIGLTHSEFPTVPLGIRTPEYTMREARQRFPFLFIKTNPILWRDFGHSNLENQKRGERRNGAHI